MSLRTGSLDVINNNEKRGVLGIELWTPNADIHDRTTLISNLEFSRTALVEEFVLAPDRAEAEWVLDYTSRPYWDIQFALGFLKYKGDFKELYRLHSALNRAGFDTFDFHLNSWIADSEFDVTSESWKSLQCRFVEASPMRRVSEETEIEWSAFQRLNGPF
jgi:hypothetical protein